MSYTGHPKATHLSASLQSAPPLATSEPWRYPKDMPKLIESEVSSIISRYLSNKGLSPLGKRSPFTHADDANERSFQIDLAIGPEGTLGNRSSSQRKKDKILFEAHSGIVDEAIRDLRKFSLFPKEEDSIMSWKWKPNPNPVYGIAIEIENNLSKYLLGSLLAAAIAGRWGMLIIPDLPGISRWIETIHRMMHKGASSPIPSNVAIFAWPTLQEHINNH